ncbi:MAG: alpha/beta fold hydrolase [Pseudomonadaceae bacterium]|nr:alpha/beta fold hydrolase [Pseudomonadaceae bacterium]
MTSTQSAPTLTVERLFSEPPLLGQAPSQLAFSPDGSILTFLAVAEDDRERLTLWRSDVESGEQRLWLDPVAIANTGAETEEEKAARERKRLFAHGITSYQWSPDGGHILLPIDGAGYLFDTSSEQLRRFTPEGTRQTDFQFSPSGKQISFVRAGNLYVYNRASDAERQITSDASDTVSNGLAEFIAAEEMHRFTGHWWSADEHRIAFTRVDEAPIPITHRHDVGPDGITTVAQRYPFTGGPNAEVKLGVFDLAAAAVSWPDWAEASDDYLARVDFSGPALVIQVQSRNQQRLTLKMLDGSSWKTLADEEQKTWINLHDGFTWLPDNKRFLWLSERSGNQQLYVGDTDGNLTPVPSNLGRVDEIVWCDDQHAITSGWQEDPTCNHIWRVALDGGGSECLSHGGDEAWRASWNDATASRDGSAVALRQSNAETPVQITLTDTQSQARQVLYKTDLADPSGYGPLLASHRTPSFGSLVSSTGHDLHYRLTLPEGASAESPCPAVIYVYGGPGVQRVSRAFAPLTNQLFAAHGFAVLELDNRGSSNREKSFEDVIFNHLGEAEVADQVLGAEMLGAMGEVDASRIGIFGHSYGGFMTLMCLAKAPDVFAAGVSAAPVTDWTLYDTHYTERYLGTPEGNPEGYEKSAIFAHLDGLKGPLLLMHGMADDNVLFTNATKLMAALQERDIAFELMTYPGSKHGLQEQWVSIHRFKLICDFFTRHLGTPQ